MCRNMQSYVHMYMYEGEAVLMVVVFRLHCRSSECAGNIDTSVRAPLHWRLTETALEKEIIVILYTILPT